MDVQGAIKWIKTAGMAAVGGGVAGAFAAMMDPSKYQFPHDFGSGKLWKFFGMGALVAFASLLVRSPLGQKAMTAYKDSQQQAKEDAALLDKVKSDIKAGVVGPAGPPPNGPSAAPK